MPIRMFPPMKRRAQAAPRVLPLLVLGVALGAAFGRGQSIDTIAGSIPLAESPEARRIPFVTPRGLALDRATQTLYVSDDGGAAIRRISLATSQSAVVAGGGRLLDDLIPIPARSAKLNFAIGLALDPAGNLYFSDDAHHRIRKLTPDGRITTVAGTGVAGFSGDGGSAHRAQLFLPKGIALDAAGNLYIADSGNGAIRRLDHVTGNISTVAGFPGNTAQGDALPARTARLRQPYGLAVDPDGNLLITDNQDHLVLRLEIATGTLRRVAGTRALAGVTGDRGPALSARLQEPRGVAVASSGDLYIGMLGIIRRVAAGTGIITTVLGNTTGFNPLLEHVAGSFVFVPGNVEALTLDEAAGVLLAVLTGSNAVGQINLRSGEFSLRAGDPAAVGDHGPARSAALAQPNKLAIGQDGSLYVADTFHHRIRRIAPGAGGVGSGVISTVAGTGMVSIAPVPGPALSGAIAFPRAVAVDAAGALYFTTALSMVRRVRANGNVDTVAGTAAPGFSGDGVQANTTRLNDPWAMTFDASGNLYIADSGNHRIRRVSPGGFITTVAGTGTAGSAGTGGRATAAQLSFPIDVRVDPEGSGLYIADQGNRRVVRLDLGTGLLTQVFAPINARGIAWDRNGRLILNDANRIYRVDPATGAAEVLAGDGLAGFSGDGGLAALARVSGLQGVVVDSLGNILFSDAVNSRIRRISAVADAPLLTLSPSELRFTATQGGANPPEQTVQLSTSNLVRAAWASAVRTESGGNWLVVRPASGATPSVVQIAANAAGLAAGEYVGTVSFGSPAAANSPLTLRVRLTVTAPQPPVLEVGPGLLTFQATAGAGSPAGKSFSITNRGGGVLEWTVLPLTNRGGNWLTASPSSGRGPAVVNIIPSTSTLPAGLYEATIRITNTSTGRVESVGVSLTLDEAGPAMLLSQTGAVFTSAAGGTAIPSESVQILNSGSGALNWTARLTPLSGGAWLRVNSASGSATSGAPSVVELQASSQADGANLPPGVYDTLVEIASDGARSSPQVLLARLRVLDPAAAPAPVVRPGSVVLVAASGSAEAASGTIAISSSGGTDLHYQISTRTSDGADWLGVAPPAGVLTGSADQASLRIEARAASLMPGFHTGSVAINFSNGTAQEVPVLLVVPPGAAAAAADAGAGNRTAGLSLPRSALCDPVSQRPWVLSLTNNIPTPTGWPVGIRAAVVDNCGNPVSRSSVIAAVNSGSVADRVVLQPLGEGQYAANYALERAGNFLITLTATGSSLASGTSEPVAANSAGLPPSQSTPGVSAVGAADGAGGRQFSSLAPGQIISISGSSLSSAAAEAPQVPLPTELNGVRVLIGGRSLPLFASGPEVMNAQVPFELPPGSDLPLVVVNQGNASPPQMVRIGRNNPGLFTQGLSAQGVGMVADSQGRPITPANPARRGEEVVAYGIGFGLTDPPVPSGTASPASPVARVTLPVRAFVGGNAVAATFAGLAPGFVGLYQINFSIPADAPAGDAVELYLEQDGNTSNRVFLPIQ